MEPNVINPGLAIQKHCQSELGEYPVTILPNSHKLIKELLDEGYKDIRDVPSESLSKDKHKIIQEVSQSQIGYVSEEINNKLMRFDYPRHYLDFESIQLSVPIWEGTRPSMQIPFQWSCHIENMNHEVNHFEFLAETRSNPEINIIESLIKTVGNEGDIFVYSHFEKTRLKALAERYPNYEQPITRNHRTLFRLLPLLKSHFYHSMKGSWSIKKVLPAVAPDLNYDLDVQDGLQAQKGTFGFLNDPKHQLDSKALKNIVKEMRRPWFTWYITFVIKQ